MKRDFDEAAGERADPMVGAMSVSFDAEDAFDQRAEHWGQFFSGPAVVAEQNAQILALAGRLAARFQSALTERTVVDQAVGILMSRGGVSAEEAADVLRVLSECEQTSVAVVADRVVREAVLQARVGRTDKT